MHIWHLAGYVELASIRVPLFLLSTFTGVQSNWMARFIIGIVLIGTGLIGILMNVSCFGELNFTHYISLWHSRKDMDICDEFLPEWFSPVATLSFCSHDGRYYHDVHHDFILEIPEGAIPKGESITIDIGVALHGPFQYPKGLRPVSPVFWVCVREQKNFQFLKPVNVTIPHFLHLENLSDIESLGLTFLKGDHEMNSQRMQQTEGDMLFKPFGKYGVLQTTHFCSLCIASNMTKLLFEKAMFCVSAFIPREVSAHQPSYAYFFVSFLLKTCLVTVEEQMNHISNIQLYERHNYKFQFSKDRALEIVLHQPPSDWVFGVPFKKKVGSRLYLNLLAITDVLTVVYHTVSLIYSHSMVSTVLQSDCTSNTHVQPCLVQIHVGVSTST